MNIKTLAAELSVLGLIFGKEVNKDLAKAYFNVLSDFTDYQMIAASSKWQKTGKFFPKPAELIEMIVGTEKQSGADAWALVLKGLRDHQICVLPPDIQEAVDKIGGIRLLAYMSFGDLAFKAKDFKDVYSPKKEDQINDKVRIGNGQNPQIDRGQNSERQKRIRRDA